MGDMDTVMRLVYGIGLIVLIAPAILIAVRSGRPVLVHIAIWLAVLVVLVFGYQQLAGGS